jgi:hypothetical protein
LALLLTATAMVAGSSIAQAQSSPTGSPEVSAEFQELLDELMPSIKAAYQEQLARERTTAHASSTGTAETLQKVVTSLNGGALVSSVQTVVVSLRSRLARIQAACPTPLPPDQPIIERMEFTRYSAAVWLCGLPNNPVLAEFTASRFWLFREAARIGRSDTIRAAGCKHWTGKRVVIKHRGCRYPRTASVFFDPTQTIVNFTCRSLNGLNAIQVNQATNTAQEQSCRDGAWTPRFDPVA